MCIELICIFIFLLAPIILYYPYLNVYLSLILYCLETKICLYKNVYFIVLYYCHLAVCIFNKFYYYYFLIMTTFWA